MRPSLLTPSRLWSVFAGACLCGVVGGGAWPAALGPLSWVGLGALLFTTRRTSVVRAAALAFAWGALVQTAGWWGVLPGGPAVALGAAAGSGVVLALVFAADRALHARCAPAWAWLPFPLAVLALEWLDLQSGTLGGWGCLVYRGVALPPFIEALVPWVGVVGAGGWIAAVLSVVASAPSPPRAPLVALLGAALAGGVASSATPSHTPGPLVIGLVSVADELDAAAMEPWMTTLERGPAQATALPTHTHDLVLDRWLDAAAHAATQGASLVLGAEGALMVSEAHEPALADTLQRWADVHGVTLVVGVGVVSVAPNARLRNEAWWVQPGAPLTRISKQRAVPGLEAEWMATPAAPPAVPITHRGWRIASIVCFDADHPSLVAERTRDADLLLVLARDWPAIDPLHGLMSRVRAIEQRIPLVRVAQHAAHHAFDARGRQLLAHPSVPADDRVILVHLGAFAP
jgi:apolipoprotein N-acyltransferase